MEITEHPRYELHAQLIEQEQQIHTIQLQDEGKHARTKPAYPAAQRSAPSAHPPASQSKNKFNAPSAKISGETEKGQDRTNPDSGGYPPSLYGNSRPTLPKTWEGGIADHKVHKLSPNADVSRSPSIDREDFPIGEDSSKFSLTEGLEDSSLYPGDQNRRLENISSSSESDTSSQNMSFEDSERMQSHVPSDGLVKTKSDEDPFERFRQWHARTSFPRDLVPGQLEGRPRWSQTSSSVDSLPHVPLSWDSNILPSEWLIRGRVIEAFNLPRIKDEEAGSFVCCISLIQDLRGVAYQRYLNLDHLKGLAAGHRIDSPESIIGKPCDCIPNP